MADAYYVLSDPTRRREYDILLNSRPETSQSSDPSASNDFFAEFAKYFSGGSTKPTPSSSTAANEDKEYAGPGVAPERPNADGIFGDVFEELLRPEVESRVPLWAWLGTASGAGIGFIVANIPGE